MEYGLPWAASLPYPEGAFGFAVSLEPISQENLRPILRRLKSKLQN